MSEPTRIHGLYTAPVTPVGREGRVDVQRLCELVDFILEGGTRGFCFGGGTSEYPYFELDQRKLYVAEAAAHVGRRAPFVVAVGAPTARAVIELGEHAVDCGAQALLIPMPYFFKYDQADLEAYVRYVTAHLDHPCLLYNLARYTNPLDTATSIRLLRDIPNLVGIKDSSLDESAIRTLADARPEAAWSLICGGDHLIFDALESGWDGAISGVACCCPEVIAVTVHRQRSGNTAGGRVAQQLVNELVETVRALPGPWAVRVALEVRGLPTGPFPYPVAAERRLDELRAFYERWFDEHLAPLRDELTTITKQQSHE